MMTEETRRIRVGMVGGGPGAGIAETHGTAMRLDDKCVLIAGVRNKTQPKQHRGSIRRKPTQYVKNLLF